MACNITILGVVASNATNNPDKIIVYGCVEERCRLIVGIPDESGEGWEVTAVQIAVPGTTWEGHLITQGSVACGEQIHIVARCKNPECETEGDFILQCDVNPPAVIARADCAGAPPPPIICPEPRDLKVQLQRFTDASVIHDDLSVQPIPCLDGGEYYVIRVLQPVGPDLSYTWIVDGDSANPNASYLPISVEAGETKTIILVVQKEGCEDDLTLEVTLTSCTDNIVDCPELNELRLVLEGPNGMEVNPKCTCLEPGAYEVFLKTTNGALFNDWENLHTTWSASGINIADGNTPFSRKFFVTAGGPALKICVSARLVDMPGCKPEVNCLDFTPCSPGEKPHCPGSLVVIPKPDPSEFGKGGLCLEFWKRDCFCGIVCLALKASILAAIAAFLWDPQGSVTLGAGIAFGVSLVLFYLVCGKCKLFYCLDPEFYFTAVGLITFAKWHGAPWFKVFLAFISLTILMAFVRGVALDCRQVAVEFDFRKLPRNR